MLAISKRGINSWRSTHGKVRDSSWHPLQSPISFTRFSLQGPTFSTKSLVARTARPSPRRPRFPQMPGHTRLRATMQRGRTFSHHRLESKAFGTLLDLCVSSRHLCCRHRQGSKWVTKCYTYSCFQAPQMRHVTLSAPTIALQQFDILMFASATVAT